MSDICDTGNFTVGSGYYVGMATRRELRSTRLQLAKEEAVLRELKKGADVGGAGNASTASDIEHSERQVQQLRAKLKKLKGEMTS
jgi:hypothetical protein